MEIMKKSLLTALLVSTSFGYGAEVIGLMTGFSAIKQLPVFGDGLQAATYLATASDRKPFGKVLLQSVGATGASAMATHYGLKFISQSYKENPQTSLVVTFAGYFALRGAVNTYRDMLNNQKLDSMNKKLDDQNSLIVNLGKDVKKVAETVDEIKTDVGTIKTDVESIKSTVNGVNAALKDKKNGLEAIMRRINLAENTRKKQQAQTVRQLSNMATSQDKLRVSLEDFQATGQKFIVGQQQCNEHTNEQLKSLHSKFDSNHDSLMRTMSKNQQDLLAAIQALKPAQ